MSALNRDRAVHGVGRAETFFAVVQRKFFSPNDFTDLAKIEHRLAEFEKRYNVTARPFQWKVTREDLHALLTRIGEHEQQDTTTSLPVAA